MMKRSSVIILSAVLASTVVLSGCQSTKRLFGGKGEQDANAPVALTAIQPTATAARLWSASVGKGEGNAGALQGPSIADNHVYASAFTGGVRALDLATGRTAWTFPSKARLSGGPGVGDGVVVVGGLDGEVIALDAATGALKWQSKISNEVIATPTVGQGLALIRGNDGKTTAFDVQTGEVRWFVAKDMPPLTVRGNDSATLGPGVAFVGNDDGSMSALVLGNGQIVFDHPVGEMSGRSDLERLADVDGSPVLDGSTLYATSFKNSTIAMDGPSGRELWTSEHGGIGRAAVSSNAVVVADRQGIVWGLDKNTGSALWKNESLKNRKIYSPVIHGDYVAVADFDGYIHWLKLDDGAFAARARVGKDAIKSNPVVSNGTLVVQDVKGRISAFSISP